MYINFILAKNSNSVTFPEIGSGAHSLAPFWRLRSELHAGWVPKWASFERFIFGENFMKTDNPGAAAANFIKQLENEI